MNIIIHFGSFLPGSLNNRNPKELPQQQQGINQKFDESSDSTGKSVVEVFIRYPTGRVISSGNCVYSTSRNVRRLLLLELQGSKGTVRCDAPGMDVTGPTHIYHTFC